VKDAAEAKDIATARDSLNGAVQRDGSITAVFERTGKAIHTANTRRLRLGDLNV